MPQGRRIISSKVSEVPLLGSACAVRQPHRWDGPIGKAGAKPSESCTMQDVDVRHRGGDGTACNCGDGYFWRRRGSCGPPFIEKLRLLGGKGEGGGCRFRPVGGFGAIESATATRTEDQEVKKSFLS